MKLEIREDKLIIEGYVNAVERKSKTLKDRIGEFIERIKVGCFKRAIKRNDDIKILLNHDWNRVLGTTKDGSLELEEDAIGLRARAEITDADVIKKAQDGDLVGWSFGFSDIEVDTKEEDGQTLRDVKDIDLYEVSILDRTKTPAYDGTIVYSRDLEGNEMQTREGMEDLEMQEEIIDKKQDLLENEELAELIANKVIEKLQELDRAKEEEEKKQCREDIEEGSVEKETTPNTDEEGVEELPEQIDYSTYEEDIKKMKED